MLIALVPVVSGLICGIMNLMGCTALLVPQNSLKLLGLVLIGVPLLLVTSMEPRTFTVGLICPGMYVSGFSPEKPIVSIAGRLWDIFTGAALSGGPALLVAIWLW